MQILNVGIFAHIDAGKTTLLERILFESGKIRKPGTIEEGTTESDYLQEEIERGISIQSALARVFWPNAKKPKVLFQFLDNPGHLDFQSQTSASLIVADLGIVLIDAFEGLKSQTLQNVEWLRKRKIPILFFLNKLDRKGIDITDSLVDLEAVLGKEPILLWKEGEGCSLLQERSSDQELLSLLEWDPKLSERYLKHPESLAELAREGFAEGFWKEEFFPVLGGAALHGDGVRELLVILELLSMSYRPEPRPGEELGIVFKRELHPDLGKIVYILATKEFRTKLPPFTQILAKEELDLVIFFLLEISRKLFKQNPVKLLLGQVWNFSNRGIFSILPPKLFISRNFRPFESSFKFYSNQKQTNIEIRFGAHYRPLSGWMKV